MMKTRTLLTFSGLLEALQSETPTSESSDSPTAQGLTGYEPPTESALLADGLVDPVRSLYEIFSLSA